MRVALVPLLAAAIVLLIVTLLAYREQRASALAPSVHPPPAHAVATAPPS